MTTTSASPAVISPESPQPNQENLSHEFKSSLHSEINGLMGDGEVKASKPQENPVTEVTKQDSTPESDPAIITDIDNFLSSEASNKPEDKPKEDKEDIKSKNKKESIKQGKEHWAKIREKASQYDLLKPKLEETENKYKEVSEKVKEYEQAKNQIKKLQEENEHSKKILERLPYVSTMGATYAQNRDALVNEIIQRAKNIGRDENEVIRALRLTPDQRDEALTEVFGITHWPRVTSVLEKLDNLENAKENFFKNPDDAIQFIKHQETEKHNKFQESRNNIVLDALKKARDKFPDFQKVEGDENHNKRADLLYNQAEEILFNKKGLGQEDLIKIQTGLISAGVAYFNNAQKWFKEINELRTKVEEYEAREMAEQELDPDINAQADIKVPSKPKSIKEELSELY